MQLTGGQMIVEHLINEGVEYVFAIPGHGNTALLDAFVDRKDQITVLPAMHEQGAAHMAAAQYRATGKIAAVCVSIGPGATNTLTALAGAYLDSVPFLLITGGVHSYMVGRGTFQEIDRPHGSNFPRMAEPVVKRWWQPSRVDQLPFTLAQAFTAMTEGRPGPVLIDIPQDVQAEFGHWDPQPTRRHTRLAKPVADQDTIEAAATMLAQAHRPVILAGGGVIAADAADALMALAEFVGAPVVHSYQGKGAFPADHELYAGGCGDIGTDAGNAMTRAADVLLAVGCRFTDRVASSYRPDVTFNIPDTTKLIQIDIDGFEIGKNYPAEIGICGDARATLDQLNTALTERHSPSEYRDRPYFAELTRLRQDWDTKLTPMRTTDHRPMTVSRALAEVGKILPRDAILVTDTGYCADQAFNEFPVYGPRKNIVSGAMSEMGFGIPTAIGAQIACPSATVFAFVGDGSVLQTGTELAVAAMLNLPIVVLALNNGGWHSVGDTQLLLHGRDRALATNFGTIGDEPYFADLAGLARSLGCAACRVDDPAELASAVQRAIESRRPTLIEARSANEVPWTAMQQTGWWDVTVPAYLTEARSTYEERRGF